jgi:hypothetical protein
MNKENKDNKENYLVIRVTDALKKDYKDYCDHNGYTMSKRIISMLKMDMNEEIKTTKK